MYICLGLLALFGIYTAFTLPVSLFPNSSKPTISVEFQYGSLTPEEFLRTYGAEFEGHLQRIQINSKRPEKISADYGATWVMYSVEFPWGTAPVEATKEVTIARNSFAARLPREIRDSGGVWANSRGGGFLALSFYSESRSLTELYELLEPVLVPELAKIQDGEQTSLYNPEENEVFLEIIPETLAAYGLFPRDIETAVRNALSSQSGGSLMVGPRNLAIQLPRSITSMETLGKVLITAPSGQKVHLSEVARIDIRPSSANARSFKTSGVPSLILFATPIAGGNVKSLAEDVLATVERVLPGLPSDIKYKKLVDPSEFIRNAVGNVAKEVALGAFLAVLVLYLFIGSFRNVGTAAIEIPMSMLLAFILMKWSGMNLNIISLGGLALSAGMNVDASVVVMENIFRHFENVKGKLSPQARLDLVMKAVGEVKFPVIASTIASLVVFLPLAFTSDLTYAILGDLAKTVVFSHGLSALVALILVPTVRLQLLKREAGEEIKPPIEKQIRWLENSYGRALAWFLERPKAQIGSYALIAVILGGLTYTVLPRLPKEIIGIPDTDWIVFSINTKGNTTVRQMESNSDEHEAKILEQFGDKIQYTFSQITSPNRASVMARLKKRSDMLEVWKALEKDFPNSPDNQYFVVPWNPAELPIPDPPHLRLVVRSGTRDERAEVANQIKELIQEKQAFPRVWTAPNTSFEEGIVFTPYQELWANLESRGIRFQASDIGDLARVATRGRSIGDVNFADKGYSVQLGYPENRVRSVEDLGALPIAVGETLVPLKALGRLEVKGVPPLIYREDGRELFLVSARQSKGNESLIPESRASVEKLVKEWRDAREKSSGKNLGVAMIFEDADRERNEAISQLALAIALSILLIFVTMVIQFGSVANALLVLVSVPLGFVGVILALWATGGTVSLNSALGVILLNGLAVANSIILVDFLKKLVDEGMAPREAAISAARQRLRPILITSLTTLLGMLPIALGHGEGGRILQPLGIAVSGGLWFSMGLTLFFVPALQVAFLEWQERRSKRLQAQFTALQPSEAIAKYAEQVWRETETSTRERSSPMVERAKDKLKRSRGESRVDPPVH